MNTEIVCAEPAHLNTWTFEMKQFTSLHDGSLPALDESLLAVPSHERLGIPIDAQHPPRILLLYGSLRERSYSRLLVEEAARILQRLGAETRIYDPRGLPQPDSVPADHPQVAELRELSL